MEQVRKRTKITVKFHAENVWTNTGWVELNDYLDAGGDIDILWKSDAWKEEMHKKYNR